ncbi:MAG: hypothetical protein U1B30_16020 [Pseudomonadota bacterium]|nr:hypothetical protein [Pseudomonadota bacterium]
MKALIQKELHHVTDEATRKVFAEIVKVVANCPAGQQVGVQVIKEPAGGAGAPAGRAKREKRAPSEYNKFMGQCARSKDKGGQGKDFKSCAVDWKRTHPQAKKR